METACRVPYRYSIVRLISPLLLVAAAGCGEEASSPTAPERPAAAVASATLTFIQVAAGLSHSCGLTTDSLAYCWGWNIFGQLGDGTTGDGSITPTLVGGGRRFRQIRAGYWHTCAINLND